MGGARVATSSSKIMARGSATLLGMLVLAVPLLARELKARITQVDPVARKLGVTAHGEERQVTVADDAKVLDEAGKPLPDGLRNARLKAGVDVTVDVEKGADGPVVRSIRIGQAGDDAPTAKKKEAPAPAKKQANIPKADMTGVKPFIDMGPSDRYQGLEGGLYPGGQNKRPAVHEQKGLELAKQIQPLDQDGKPSPDGKIVVLGIGFSNSNQCYTGFINVSKNDTDIDPHVVLVNGCMGALPAREAQKEDGKRGNDGALYWPYVDDQLAAKGASRAQVQVAWIKETDPGPSGGFPNWARNLQGEIERIVKLMTGRFPNLKMIYLSSRSWAGFSSGNANPEPYAFESGYSVKWLIQDQLEGKPGMVDDPATGKRVPWLSWGPYLWTNGTQKRSDGHSITQADYRAGEGLHHSEQGIEKMGKVLLNFFKTYTTTRTWFLKPSARPPSS
jgi:hypothetical protein